MDETNRLASLAHAGCSSGRPHGAREDGSDVRPRHHQVMEWSCGPTCLTAATARGCTDTGASAVADAPTGCRMRLTAWNARPWRVRCGGRGAWVGGLHRHDRLGCGLGQLKVDLGMFSVANLCRQSLVRLVFLADCCPTVHVAFSLLHAYRHICPAHRCRRSFGHPGATHVLGADAACRCSAPWT